jgi:hypothetical protein
MPSGPREVQQKLGFHNGLARLGVWFASTKAKSSKKKPY